MRYPIILQYDDCIASRNIRTTYARTSIDFFTSFFRKPPQSPVLSLNFNSIDVDGGECSGPSMVVKKVFDGRRDIFLMTFGDKLVGALGEPRFRS